MKEVNSELHYNVSGIEINEMVGEIFVPCGCKLIILHEHHDFGLDVSKKVGKEVSKFFNSCCMCGQFGLDFVFCFVDLVVDFIL